jgi:hypothetical protein
MKKGGNAFDAMVAAELALAALQEILRWRFYGLQKANGEIGT